MAWEGLSRRQCLRWVNIPALHPEVCTGLREEKSVLRETIPGRKWTEYRGDSVDVFSRWLIVLCAFWFCCYSSASLCSWFGYSSFFQAPVARFSMKLFTLKNLQSIHWFHVRVQQLFYYCAMCILLWGFAFGWFTSLSGIHLMKSSLFSSKRAMIK